VRTGLSGHGGAAWANHVDHVVTEASSRAARIGLSGQDAAVDPFLTGQENLVMIGWLYGLSRRRRASAPAI